MNRVLHKIIFLTFGAILLHLSSDGCEAAVYKWKDETGKIHFTDDPNRVPEVFRKEHFKRKRPPAIQKSISPVKPEEKSILKKEGMAPENEEDTEKEGSKKDEGLTAAEKSAAQALIAFFEEDIPRYDEIYKIPPGYRLNGIRKWKTLQRTAVATIPQKKALVEQVSVSERPLFKEITVFLKKAIEADEEVATYGALISKNTRPRVNKLSSRLNAQAASEEKFIEQLEGALEAPDDLEKK
ncbi:MAG: hypothetical protein ACI8PD_000524 [Nitrospinales bacterium]|jgi:hypothetical protein